MVVREALMEPLRKCQVAKQFSLTRTAEGVMQYHPCTNYPNCAFCPMELHHVFTSSIPLPAGGNVCVPAGTSGIATQCMHCGAQRISLYDVPSEGLVVPVVCFEDFEKALLKAHSSVGTDELQRFVDWTAEFGQEG